MFLGTGRCGTQWLTAGLRALYSGIDVEHEPIGPLYQPRRFFRSYRDPEAMLRVSAIHSHVRRIEGCRRLYVETGWPLFPILPLLCQRVPERLRIVHLTRHPVPTALSHLAHQSYAGSPRDDAYTRLATLGPEDPGVFETAYMDPWDTLHPYEKCLFWWNEVHRFGLELPQRFPRVPFLRVKSEAILSGRRPHLEQMLEFMQLSWVPSWTDRASKVIDRWHHHTDADVDPSDVFSHGSVLETADRLGYEMRSLDAEALLARYRGTPDPGLDRW